MNHQIKLNIIGNKNTRRLYLSYPLIILALNIDKHYKYITRQVFTVIYQV